MDQPSGTTPATAAAPPADGSQAVAGEAAGAAPVTSGFGARGRLRRRARFLRKARELAYRDLGGLVFNLHRFGQRNDALVLNKLNTLAHIDQELRTLETALDERDPITVLREAGITACPRCAAIHSGDDRFCPNCGLSMSRQADLPIAGAPPAPVPPPAPAAAAAAAPAPAPATSAAPSPVAPAPAQGAAEAVRQASAQATASWPAPSPSPGAATGRSPTPPGRSPSPPSGQAPPSSSGEEERTEILHPVEPDR